MACGVIASAVATLYDDEGSGLSLQMAQWQLISRHKQKKKRLTFCGALHMYLSDYLGWLLRQWVFATDLQAAGWGPYVDVTIRDGCDSVTSLSGGRDKCSSSIYLGKVVR